MDKITVALTREQWEQVASLCKAMETQLMRSLFLSTRMEAIRDTRCAEIGEIRGAICDQAGLPEVFRCE